MVAGSLL